MTDKNRKYDRQLRLWGSSGQASLEQCHVCLVGATATGSETVKNLVLPGVGRLTIMDNATVDEADVSSNFFLTEDSVGQPRSRAVQSLIAELNPDVECEALEYSAQDCAQDPAVWGQFQMVVASGQSAGVLETLSQTLYDLDIPLLIVDSVGFYGFARVVTATHTTVETHPESVVDLRLDRPWKELDEFCQTFDLASMHQGQLAHVPFVVLLFIHLHQWRQAHGGRVPASAADRRQFRQQLEPLLELTDDPENVDEALAAVWRLAQPSQVPATVVQLISDPLAAANHLDKHSPSFWILVAALGRYLALPESEGLLPLPGALPDMKASTESYVRLQSIYKARAETDFCRFQTLYSSLCAELGRAPISDEEGRVFCRHCRFLTVQRGSVFRTDETVQTEVDEGLKSVYVGLKAVKKVQDAGHALSLGSLTAQAATIAKESAELAQVLRELARTGGVELHNVAAVMGGIAAQEAVKLITHQYVALDNTVVYDAIVAKTAAFKCA